MTRVLLILAVLVALSLMVRRAFQGAARDESKHRGGPPGRRSGPPGARRKSPHLPPDTLVCGVCGQSFDPDKTGWICPKCGK